MKTVERERLYEQVWATPLTQLCKSYGLSYQGLRKLCVELNVPIPPRGYWARIAAGATFSIPELPTEGQEEKLLPESDASEKKLQAKRIVAASAAASNNHGQEKLHPVVVPIQKKYLEAESEALRSKQRFDWEIANPGKRYPKRGLKNYYESWEGTSNNPRFSMNSAAQR